MMSKSKKIEDEAMEMPEYKPSLEIMASQSKGFEGYDVGEDVECIVKGKIVSKNLRDKKISLYLEVDEIKNATKPKKDEKAGTFLKQITKKA
jgi:hypothetical protein